MKLLDQYETLKLLCKSTGKWGILVHFPQYEWYDKTKYTFEEFWANFLKAAPWFDIDNNIHSQAWADEFGIILCESEEECDKIYNSTVGDDGPTELNKYDGFVRVYCLTCDDKGETRNENT